MGSMMSRRQLLDTEKQATPSEFKEANWGAVEERQRARIEFETFVLSTWRQLVAIQKGNLCGTPCTAMFCRMDIGVMMRDDRISYFVNEVERSLTTSLWMSSMPHALHGVLADTLGFSLHRWLKWFHDPCQV